MKSIRVENIRSLVDTTLIDLQPITLLIGENSSGKSSFLRIFPLLKQSAEAVKNGPILWFGRFVDFGDFDKTININNKEDDISIHLVLDVDYEFYDGMVYDFYSIDSEKTEMRIGISISKDNFHESSYIKKLYIEIYDHKIKFLFHEDKIQELVVNECDFSDHCDNFSIHQALGILPNIFEKNLNKRQKMVRFGAFNAILFDKLKKLMHGSTKDDTIFSIISSLHFGSSLDILRNIKNNPYSPRSWKNEVNGWDSGTDKFIDIKNYVVANSIMSIINLANERLRRNFANIYYIGPIRATAERYYRYQDLSVNEIDFQGRNLPIFLNSFNSREKIQFSSWVEKNFGIKIKINSEGSHISLTVSEYNSKNEYNLADTGFGFSQVLPILTQLWLLTNNRRMASVISIGDPVIYAIEQPELHLHPRLQAKLADIFVSIVNSARDLGIQLKMLIETHSEAMINRFGHSIAENILDEKNISAIVFEKHNEITSIRKSYYDKDGFLKNWPLGFFEVDE